MVLLVKVAPPSVEILKPPPIDQPEPVAAYTVLPYAYISLIQLSPKPFAVVLLVKVAKPSEDILNPLAVAAYTVLPDATTPFTRPLGNPVAAVAPTFL